jgi:ParB/RepB/Spo0J family partition protein
VLDEDIIRTEESEEELFELVIGERRCRAASLADQVKIKTCIEDLTDDEVVNKQMIENVQRENLSPMDEAVYYKTLVEQQAIMPKELSLRLGKPLEYVRGRLLLNNLLEEGQQLVQDCVLPLIVADLIASLQPADQHKLLTYAIQHSYGPGDKENERPQTQHCRSLAEVRWFMQTNILMRLDDAPFSKTERVGTLKPPTVVSVTCVTCPQRTGAHATLFNDLVEGERCMNRKCFTHKFDTHFAEMTKKCLDEQGQEPVFVRQEVSVPAPRYSPLLREVRVVPEGAQRCADTQPGYLLSREAAPQLISVCMSKWDSNCVHRVGATALPTGPPAAPERRAVEHYAYTPELLRQATRNRVTNRTREKYRELVRDRLEQSQPLEGTRGSLLVVAHIAARQLPQHVMLKLLGELGHPLRDEQGTPYVWPADREGENDMLLRFPQLLRPHLEALNGGALQQVAWAAFVEAATRDGQYEHLLSQDVITSAVERDLKSSALAAAEREVEALLAQPELQPGPNGTVLLSWEQVTRWDIDTPDQVEDALSNPDAADTDPAEVAASTLAPVG